MNTKPKHLTKPITTGRCAFCGEPLVLSVSDAGTRIFRCEPCGLFGQAVTPPREFRPRPREKRRKKKVMARRRLTFEEQLKGVRAAIRSNKAPPQLREGLRKWADWLAGEIRRGQRTKRRKKKTGSYSTTSVHNDCRFPGTFEARAICQIAPPNGLEKRRPSLIHSRVFGKTPLYLRGLVTP